jgi:transcriptional regulator of acetoin/glycerol metabolism
LRALVAHDWPGNVRELRSVVERAAILADGDRIDTSALPAELRGGAEESIVGGRSLAEMTYREAIDHARDESVRRYLEAVLRAQHGNVSAAAQHAGVERESFHRLLRRHGMRAESFRDEEQ